MNTRQHRQHQPWTPFALLSLVVILASACGLSSSFELHWTLDGKAIQGPKDCASAGIDAIEVIARRGSDETRAIFGCFSALDGPVGRGPDLASGPWALGVRALSPGGLGLSSEVVVQAEIPSEGNVRVQVDLPRPSSCADGVDNDKDGAVDAFDASCLDAQGAYDPQGSEH